MIPTLNRRRDDAVHRAVIVSPHLDDAVFSCGGRIARWAREGPVLVINVFTDFTGAPRRARAPLGEERWREESAASGLLGFTSVALGEKDCVCRSSKYLAPGRLFGGVLLREDPLDPVRLREKLARVLAGLSWRELVLPLGVGWHVDHVAVHEATRDYHLDPRTLFYEDLPYAHVPGFTERRLAELGHVPCDNRPRALRRDGRRAAEVVSTWAPFAGLRFRWLRRGARWVAARFFAGLFRRRARRAAPGRWESRPGEISDAYELKKKACFLYTSQIRAFFIDESSWEKHARAVPGPDPEGVYERYWRRVS